MRWALKHQLNYIEWRKEGKEIILTKEQMQSKLDEFKKTRKIAKSKTKTQDYIHGDTYTYTQDGYWQRLYCYENKEFRCYKSHSLDNDKNKAIPEKDKHIGHKSFTRVSKLFTMFNETTPKTAFGYCNRAKVQKCIPRPVYYINEPYKDMILRGVSKADFSSNYPSRLIGKMPDWHTRVYIKGTVKPTKEYPFAFYVRSGHLAEYNTFDTHEWLGHPLGRRLFSNEKYDPTIKEDRDLTVLCKPSKYNFDLAIQALYKLKCEGKSVDGIPAKTVLNSFIGYMHLSNKDNKHARLDHLAAIVIGRANQLMMNTYDELRQLNVPILQIIVDGIIYKGNIEIGYKQEDKELGRLMQEFTNVRFRMKAVNQYMFRDKDDNLLEYKHGAFDGEITEELQTSFEAMDKWRKLTEDEKTQL